MREWELVKINLRSPRQGTSTKEGETRKPSQIFSLRARVRVPPVHGCACARHEMHVHARVRVGA